MDGNQKDETARRPRLPPSFLYRPAMPPGPSIHAATAVPLIVHVLAHLVACNGSEPSSQQRVHASSTDLSTEAANELEDSAANADENENRHNNGDQQVQLGVTTTSIATIATMIAALKATL